jgi:fructokinase
MMYGALEAGGTKMVCAIGDEYGHIFDRIRIPTGTPQDTMPLIIEYFSQYELESLGIACFGPIDLHKGSTTYGYILNTPKLAWRNYNILGTISEALGIPCGFDTDVNGSLLGEVTFGCARGLTDVIYLTIGTGIGGGVMTGGRLLHGMLHPELGHIIVNPRADDNYAGNCPYHGRCLEGMAAGPAIEKRLGQKAEMLTDNNTVWKLEAYYIAQALCTYIMTLSPQKIILGGGVMHQNQLIDMIRDEVVSMVGGYIDTREFRNIKTYISTASLNDDQGILGAIKLAIDCKL